MHYYNISKEERDIILKRAEKIITAFIESGYFVAAPHRREEVVKKALKSYKKEIKRIRSMSFRGVEHKATAKQAVEKLKEAIQYVKRKNPSQNPLTSF